MGNYSESQSRSQSLGVHRAGPSKGIVVTQL